MFYGTTSIGGTSGKGNVYELNSGVVTQVASLTGVSSPNTPQVGLVKAGDGNFYGASTIGGSLGKGSIFRFTAPNTITRIYSFTTGTGAAPGPKGELVVGDDGRMYGTTHAGGISGKGTIFSIGTDGSFTLLHTFASDGSEGSAPIKLVNAGGGTFYGACQADGPDGHGSFFSITSAGTFTLIATLDALGGYHVGWSALRYGADANLYGFTADNGFFCKITVPSGAVTMLCDVQSSIPYAAFGSGGTNVCLASDGKFYCATNYTTSPPVGAGSCAQVISLTTAGTLSILHEMAADFSEGANFSGDLIEGSDGVLYGCSVGGGTSAIGVVFSCTKAGVYSVIHSFANSGDGDEAYGALVSAS